MGPDLKRLWPKASRNPRVAPDFKEVLEKSYFHSETYVRCCRGRLYRKLLAVEVAEDQANDDGVKEEKEPSAPDREQEMLRTQALQRELMMEHLQTVRASPEMWRRVMNTSVKDLEASQLVEPDAMSL